MASATVRAARIRVKDGGDMEGKDASRPFFQRQPGEIGVYIVVYDAVATNPKEFGSEHFFIMDLMDRLHEQLASSDLVKLRNSLERKGHFKGTYMERFEKGIVLAVGFDNADALENVWKMHVAERLTAVIQDALICPALMKTLRVTKLVLATRMFEDEYSNCRNELRCREETDEMTKAMERLSIKSKENDMALVKRLKTHQVKFSDEVQNIREIEYEFNKHLGEFIMTVKQVLPPNISEIKTLKEFETNMKMAKGLQGKKMVHIDRYLDIIRQWRTVMTDIDEHVCQPVLQIHSVYETDKQRQNKAKIRASCKEMQDQLRPDADLRKANHSWSKKLMKKEQGLFGGLISLVPLGADTAFDINCTLDEYLNDFPL